jgi:hypothetical protein
MSETHQQRLAAGRALMFIASVDFMFFTGTPDA